MSPGGVWIACAHRRHRKGTIERFDPKTGLIDLQEETDWPVYDLAVSGDSILATMGLAVSSTTDGGSGVFDLGAGGEGGGGGDGGGGN